ncbi:MAG TPA: hypothetical protein PLO67_07555 [Saprospiraceae bacterium]|nr:hypothetical protein [Saprospiraceae bacterium]
MFKGKFFESFPVLSQQANWPPRRYWLLAGLCAAVFAVLMPRDEVFPYRFQEGQPWSYRSLHAPFDFEVLYPDEQVRAEVERVNTEHAPYFYLNPDVARQQKKRFARLVTEQADISRHDTQFDDLVRNQAAYISFGSQMLDIIYSRGIADPAEEAFRDTPGFIYLLTPNSEKKVPVAEVGTINHAKSFLTDTLPFSPLRQPELLLPLLEKSLAINIQFSDSLTIVHKRRKMAAVTGTGVVVHQGEQVVQPGEIVTQDLSQKLQSLQRRYHTDESPYYPIGAGLLALLVFGALLFGARAEQEKLFPLISISVLVVSLTAGWLGRVGEAAPLLLPLWALPLVFPQRTGKGVWAAVIFLTTISFSWASGWFALQAAGFFSAQIFDTHQATWRRRIFAAGGILAGLLLTLVGLAFSGKLPATMRWTDAVTFLALGAVLSLAVFPLKRLLENGNTSDK